MINIYVSNSVNKKLQLKFLYNLSNNLKINFISNFNDFDNIDIMIKADNIYQDDTLKKMKKKKIMINYFLKNRYFKEKSILINNDSNYFPYTFYINNFNDLIKIKKCISNYKNNLFKFNKNFGNNWWILKLNESYGGFGTKLFTENQLYDYLSNNKINNFIIQKYLENPYIYNEGKTDFRCYILVIPKIYFSKKHNKYKIKKNKFNFYLNKFIIGKYCLSNFFLDENILL
jgi:hypothetical protein